MWAARNAFNMTETPKTTPDSPPDGAALEKELSPAARRALEEAAARHKAEKKAPPPAEKGGPAGEEPTRYGDWERGGRAVDF